MERPGNRLKCPICCVSLALACLTGVDWAAEAAEPPPTTGTAPERRPALSSLTSTSGRFFVVGPDHRENLDMANWAEDVADRIQRMTGLKPAEDDLQGLSIVLRRGVPSAPGAIRLEQAFDAREMRQSLTIENLSRADVEDVLEVLCRAILDRRVIQRAREMHDAKRLEFMARDGSSACGAPGWFVRGVAQDMAPLSRARNSDRALARLRAGHAEPIALFLDQWKWPDPGEPVTSGDGPARAPRDLDTRAVSGEFVGWVLSLPDKAARIQKLLDRAAEGTGVPAVWVAANLLDGGDLADLDEAWDRQVVMQRRVVNRPGVTTLDDVKDLRLDLELYAGDHSIPVAGTPLARLEWKDLIRLKGEPWIPAFARSKAAGLMARKAGRGTNLDRVVDAYREFLDGLAGRSSDRRLNRWLASAEERTKALEESLRKEPAAGPAGGAVKGGTGMNK